MGVGSLYSDALWTILKLSALSHWIPTVNIYHLTVTTSFSSLGVVTDDAISQLEHIRIALVSLLCYCQAWNPRGDPAPQNADTSMFHKKIRYHLDCKNLRKTINCLPMHCRQVPPSRNDKPLPRQHSLAVFTPVTSFPPQPVASWHDWNCAEPVGYITQS